METSSKKAYAVMFILSLAIFAPTYSQFQMSAIASQITSAYSLTMPQFVSLYTAPMITAIFLSIVSGVIVDRFGYKWVIFASILVTCLGTIARLYVTSYGTFFIAMMMMGTSAAFINANAPKIIGQYFPLKKSQVMVGVYLAVSTVAMTFGVGTTALFPDYRMAFYFAAILCVLVLIMWPIMVREDKYDSQATPSPDARPSMGAMDARDITEARHQKVDVRESLKHVFKEGPVIKMGVTLFFVMGGYMALTSYFPSILSEKGISDQVAGVMTSLVSFGNLIACIVIPLVVSKRQHRRLISLIACGGIAFISLIIGFFSNIILLSLGLLLMGFFCGSLVPIFMSMPILYPPIGQKYAGTAGGLLGTLQLMGGVVLPSYIIAPLARTNQIFYGLVAGAYVLAILAMWTIPYQEIERANGH